MTLSRRRDRDAVRMLGVTDIGSVSGRRGCDTSVLLVECVVINGLVPHAMTMKTGCGASTVRGHVEAWR